MNSPKDPQDFCPKCLRWLGTYHIDGTMDLAPQSRASAREVLEELPGGPGIIQRLVFTPGSARCVRCFP